MIVSNLKNCQKYNKVHKDFERVFSFLQNLPCDATGKYVLEEGKVWAGVISVTAEPKEQKIFEAHREFIDIHYILSGKEKFGYADIERLKTIKEYNIDGDYALYEGTADILSLKQGDFVVTFPEDAHIPDYEKIGNDTLTRVVIKIKI